jgi:BirA family biotin operon repressor/biotin-[acetyl-CoA-carboxylase] ligase
MQLDPIAAGAGVRLESLAATRSTNAEARMRALRGERGPLWVTATTQTAGRGRHGRSWISLPGNLYASLLLTDPSSSERAPQLAFVAALALRDAMIAQAPPLEPQLAFKWPNDVLLGGRKCAGILIEGETLVDREADAPKRLIVIVGVGVNLVVHPAAEERRLAFPATDLRAHGAEITPAQLFAPLSATMCRRIAQWDGSRGFAAILEDWLACARGLGEPITVRNNGLELQGRFVGLDQSGQLMLELPDSGVKTIAAGDVFPFDAHGARPVAETPG